MTEAYEDELLVRVRAQVMCRDEGTGGWLPLGGGGLSNVMVCRRPNHAALKALEGPLPSANKSNHYKQMGGSGSQLETAGVVTGVTRCCAATETSGESAPPDRVCPHKPLFFIYGKRISDQSMVLYCTIKRDFKYNKVMPTFHHWLTDEKRFGLTFQTAADARAFDRGVKTAVDDLRSGLGGAWRSLSYKKPSTGASADDEDDNIFECLNLPSDSRSSSENSTASRSALRQQQQHLGVRLQPAVFHLQSNLYTDTPPALSASARELLMKKKLSGSCSEEPPMFVEDPLNADNYSYVQLTQVHEYVYPSLGSGVVTVSSDRSPSQSALQRRDSGSSLKKRSQPPGMYAEAFTLADGKRDRDLNKKPLPIVEGFHNRLKCRHCQEWYIEDTNKAGSCEYAPDCFRSCINTATGIQCAQCMMYHCMSDPEGEFVTHPCSCTPIEDGCGRRWLGLALLSILVPCLWCYPPMRAVHWCCVGCGLAGGRHIPLQRSLHAYSHH